MKSDRLFLYLVPIIILILSGCSKNNSTGPVNDGGSGNIIQQVHSVGKLQDDNDVLLSALLQKGDTTKALDSVVSIINKDTSVSFCNKNSQGIIIQYKSGIRGGIFLDPEDPSSSLSKKTIREKSSYIPSIPKSKIIPSSKKTIFINPHYSDRVQYANSIMNLENTIFPRVGFNAPVTFLDETATVDVFSNLAGYGIIYIYSHGWAWPDKYDITEVYLMTGENVNDVTTQKYYSEIAQGDIPLVKIHEVNNKYFISPEFFAIKNNFEKDSSIVYGGFCFGFLGSWPDRIINTSKALSYTGFNWSVYTDWNAYWGKSLFDSLTNKTYKTPMSLYGWFTNTPTIPKQYYNSEDDITVRIEMAGRADLTLWGKVIIDSISPNHGKINDIVAIYGKGFGSTQEGSSVSFNGINASPTTWTDTKITTSVPAGASNGYVIVKKGNDESNKVYFTVDGIGPQFNSITISFQMYALDEWKASGKVNGRDTTYGRTDTVAYGGVNIEDMPIKMSGNSFSGEASVAGGVIHTSVSGGVDPNSKKLSLAVTITEQGGENNGYSVNSSGSYTINDLPLTVQEGTSLYWYRVQDSDVCSYVGGAVYNETDNCTGSCNPFTIITHNYKSFFCSHGAQIDITLKN